MNKRLAVSFIFINNRFIICIVYKNAIIVLDYYFFVDKKFFLVYKNNGRS